jgi:hypothetical protein
MSSERMATEADHLDYLRVVLFSGRVMPEEGFDKLALEHLRPYRLTGRLKAMKEALLVGLEAYRLELRGRAYLCALRSAGVKDDQGRPTVVAWDVVELLERLALEANRGDGGPPKKAKVVFYD